MTRRTPPHEHGARGGGNETAWFEDGLPISIFDAASTPLKTARFDGTIQYADI